MPAKPTTTLTVRLSSETKAKLDRLAEITERSKSFLVGRMLDDYIDREIEICEGTLEAIRSIQRGDGIPHEQVVQDIDRLIADAYTRRNRKSA